MGLRSVRVAALSNVLDLGEGRRLLPICLEDDGPTVGYIEEHPDARDRSQMCAGVVYIAEHPEHGRPRWTVEQADPLTLSPSILCRTCGNHGFVRNGVWVPA